MKTFYPGVDGIPVPVIAGFLINKINFLYLWSLPWALTSFFGNAYRRPLSDIVTSARPELNAAINSNSLGQNFPNPFRISTKIRYTITNTGKVVLSIFDVYGKEIANLENIIQSPGTYEFEFNAQNLKSGAYFYRLNAGNYTMTRKLLVTGNK
ncbi:MAG: T9SS type A sorting domain-containing protein [Bacteroidota bacterium]|nr:hypothetical protein [Odoribacter sp.]MDP3642109.1 T9SS type A sorting domain-containing protein [Bacteroidota bacterium]